jgi:crossover junction endodeoxyribonuclease RuvC
LRVLGIDPGMQVVGYGLVRLQGNSYGAETYGIFKPDRTDPFPQRLYCIHQFITRLLEELKPDIMAIEEVYINQNARTSLMLGHARGVIMLAAVEKAVPVSEYAPREIKQAVVGRGGASKQQIQWMMGQLLKIRVEELCEDAADGLAVALCHGLRHSKDP